MAHRHSARHGGGRGQKRHPLLVAGAAVGAVAIAYLLLEKKASASTSSTSTSTSTTAAPQGTVTVGPITQLQPGDPGYTPDT